MDNGYSSNKTKSRQPFTQKQSILDQSEHHRKLMRCAGINAWDIQGRQLSNTSSSNLRGCALRELQQLSATRAEEPKLSGKFDARLDQTTKAPEKD